MIFRSLLFSLKTPNIQKKKKKKTPNIHTCVWGELCDIHFHVCIILPSLQNHPLISGWQGGFQPVVL